jgi:uncharacterized membrane protein
MGKIFFRGLIAVAPVAITIALVTWIFAVLEGIFRPLMQSILGQYYFPGLGILVALVLILVVGTVINNWVIQKMYGIAEKIVRKIPLIKTLYNSVSDLMGFIGTGNKEKLGYVVILRMQGMKVLGFVTRENMEDISQGSIGKDEVAVYVPFSYQIGGYTYFVPKSDVERIDMSVEHAMRFALTAGILKNHDQKPSGHK